VRNTPVSTTMSAKHFKKGPALPAGAHIVFPPQPGRFLDVAVNTVLGRCGQTTVGLDAGHHAGTGGFRLQEAGGKAFERVVPVVVTRYGVDGFREAFEGKVELRLIIEHCPGRVNHIRGDESELHIGPLSQEQVLVPQRLLRGAALARVAQDEKGKIRIAADAVGLEQEQALGCNMGIALLDGLDHVLAPDVGAGRRPVIPDAGGPALAVEKPAEAPHRVDRDQDRRGRQANLEPPAQSSTR